MANLRTNNLSGEQGQNAYRGSVVFGGGDGGSAGLLIADNSDLELGSETNWTIEFWLWLNGSVHGDYDVILGKGSATGNNYEYFVEVMSDNTLDFFSTTAGSAWDFQQQISPVLSHDSWHHIAIVRNGSGSNSLKSYVNGQEHGSFTAQNIHTSAYPFGIGYFAGGNNLYSKVTVSNLRIVKGTSVYTAAFTPPFTELKAIPNTVLLCCQDSDNPFKEETGKTITGVGHLANGAVIHPKNIPPYGVDAGNVFGGPIQQSTQGYMYFQSGRTVERGGTRALMIGGFSPGGSDTINFVNVATEGTALDFGNLSRAAGYCGAMGGRTRGVIPLQYQMTPSEATTNIIEFLTILTEGNTQDFGDMATSTYGRASASNDVRGIISGGEATEDAMEFITLASLGNGSSFGDLTQGRREPQSTADPTRMVTAGGYASPSTGTRYNIIDFVTIATTGNAQDFGDLTVTRWKPAACADATRGVFAGGGTPSNLNVIDFITIQSTGDATDFGDLVLTSSRGSAGSDSIRGVIFTGFSDTGSHTANIDSIIIQTTGSAKRFGETTTDTHSTGGLSNGHGGLS